MKPLISKKYKLERIQGKGGWTFARIPEVAKDKTNPFGWVKVRAIIDGYEIRKLRLMPMGNGFLFLPVKAEIRKKIGKGEGDTVLITLYPDNEPLEIPEELLLCLKDDPTAFKFFKSLSESEQQFYIQWIFSAKKEETKVRRLTTTTEKLARGLKMYERM